MINLYNYLVDENNYVPEIVGDMDFDNKDWYFEVEKVFVSEQEIL